MVLGQKVIESSRSCFCSDLSNGMTELVSAQDSNQGIISAAIANAAALPIPPGRGKENTSLFEQQSSKKSSSTKTQFTFTCESGSANSMIWPNTQSPPSHWDSEVQIPKTRASQKNNDFARQGAQMSPNLAHQPGESTSQHPGVTQQPQQPPKKPRRTLSRQYDIAARDRRLRQEYTNFHHPPKDEDIWICQFCEYESIYGERPEYLIGQYEAKDRRERKRLAEKRRLLEKAKMKGRKGKKGNKNSKNANLATQPPQQHQRQRYGEQHLDEAEIQHQGTQTEEYVSDDYDGAPVPMSAPLQTPSKIPQPVSQNQSHSLRPPSGSATLRGNVARREITHQTQ